MRRAVSLVLPSPGNRRAVPDPLLPLSRRGQTEALNRGDRGFGPRETKALFPARAHLDLCGRIPKLAWDGFRVRIHATLPAIAPAKTLVLDSALIQETEAKGKSRKNRWCGSRTFAPAHRCTGRAVPDKKAVIPAFAVPPAQKHLCIIGESFPAGQIPSWPHRRPSPRRSRGWVIYMKNRRGTSVKDQPAKWVISLKNRTTGENTGTTL